MSRPSTPLSAFASLRTGLGAALCALAAVLTPPAHAQLRGLGPFAQVRDTAAALPAGVQRLADVPYGADPLQRMDVYLPAAGSAASSAAVASGMRAPVIFMVHGGAWRTGDKAMSRVVQEKVARWVPKGFVFISVNYRLYPAVNVLQEAQDVAMACLLYTSPSPRD